MKKALALILTLIMVLGLMPAAMAATAPESQQQIGNYAPANDTNGALGEPTEGTLAIKSLEDGKVIISKTIAGTETENVFDITLTVKTTEEIKEVTSETADAAVVLVIDISNSMSSNMMANAQKAAQEFINSFAPAGGDKSKRKIAIVAFGTHAHQISGWVDASTFKTASGAVHSTISGINPNINGDSGGTNMHAGLLKASELLKDSAISSISNKNVLLFTDGVPTFYNDKGELGGYGNTNGYSQIDHDNHAKVETTVHDKFSGIGKYAVYLGNKRIYCEKYKCPLHGYDYDDLFGHHNDGGETVNNWLKSLKSSDGTSFAAYSTSNASELANIFKSISELIKLKAQAWQLTDPMGDNIEFVQFLGADIDNKQATQSGGTISWDLKRDITKVPDDANKAYTYTLSYRIKLNTLSSGFKKDTFYKTNGVTDLTYFIEEEGIAGGLQHAYFNVPSVMGFAGDLTFTKVNADYEPLAGAEFTLTTTDKDGWEKTATSGEDGQVKFENIPSGHTYTLTETQAPNNYEKSNDEYTVTVSYGEVTVTKKDNNEDNNEVVYSSKDGNNNFTVVNTPDKISVTVAKVWVDADNQDGIRPASIQVQLKADGNNYGDSVTLNAGNQWSHTWENLPKKAAGADIVYTVAENSKVEGYTTTVTGSVADGFTITNTKLAEGKTVVTVQKTWEAPDGTIFPEVSVNVFKDNKVVDTIKLNKDNGWMGSSKELDEYPNGATVGDEPIKYTVREVVPDGYTAIGTVYDETEKVWQITNKIDEQYTVKLVKKVEGYEGPLSEVEVTVENEEGTYKKTHKVPVNGYKDIQVPAGTYTVTENTTDIQVPGYTLNTTYEPNKFTVPAEIAETAETADTEGIAATVTVTNTYTKNSPTPTPTPTPTHSHRHDPVPPIFIPPKTGDMTFWAAVLALFGF